MADDAWALPRNPQAAQGDIGIPMTVDGGAGAVGNGEEGWGNDGAGGRRTPPVRRSSRSRSPGRRNGDAGGPRGDGEYNPGNNLHVSGLSSRVDTRQLEEMFAKFGRVQKASVMLDPHTRESRGFGFVTMEGVEGAEAAMTALNGTELMGKTLVIQKARRGRGRTPTPGRYYGPPKRGDGERPYDPRPYDSRYDRRGPPPSRGGYEDRYDSRGGGGGGGGRYDDRDRGRSYNDRSSGGDRAAGGDRGGAADRGGGGGGGGRYEGRDSGRERYNGGGGSGGGSGSRHEARDGDRKY